ncbi:MAG: AMIN domain-containing protein, partial [Desulfovibrionaceae bacterium]|nr:AMIN domain-containing protein [Desulfovibrionaceae bacterium]
KPAARKPAAKPAEDKPAAEKPAAKPAPEKPAPKARPAEQDKSRITVFARETGATVRIALGRTVTGYKPMLLDNPDRLVVDITGEYPDLRAPGVPSNPLVTNVRLGKYDNRTRVVIDLKKAPGKHRIILSEDRQRIDVRVDR